MREVVDVYGMSMMRDLQPLQREMNQRRSVWLWHLAQHPVPVGGRRYRRGKHRCPQCGGRLAPTVRAHA